MKKHSYIFYLIICFTSITLFELTLSSCASISSPTGGERDTAAPILDTAFPPNFSTHFQSDNIELIFNEYLNLKSPNQQIVISPKLEEDLDIQLKGKSIFLNLTSDLEENTTYTISFGSSVTDFTEGNANTNLKYIFSTGSYIDSLEISGQVKDSYEDLPVKEILVALYQLHDTIVNKDSIPFNKAPSYYTYTDENGFYKMEYLKPENFQLIAFEDLQGDFKLNGAGEKLGFYGEAINTISSNKKALNLSTFIPEPNFKFFGARHKAQGLIRFGFSRPVPNINISILNGLDSISLIPNTTGDTLDYWYTEELDSISFLVSGYEILDTAELFLRDYDDSKLQIKPLTTNLRSFDTIKLLTNLPIDSITSDNILLYNSKDTLKPEILESNNPFEIRIKQKLKTASYSLQLEKGSVQSIFKSKNDSLNFSFNRLKKEDLGNLKFEVKTDSNYSYVLEIYNSKQEKVLTESFNDSIALNLKDYYPGEYQAQLILDGDKNGKWTTGDYFAKRQAESIIKYKEAIEIRANWDLELEWKVNFPD